MASWSEPATVAAAAPAAGVRVVRHASALGAWELAFGRPGPALRRHVRQFCGYEEDTPGFTRRLELPGTDVTLIVGFGPPIRVAGPRQATGPVELTSFVAGLYDGPAEVTSPGHQRGIEVDLTPFGARRLLGVPMHELANRTVELSDVLGPGAARLADRLQAAPDWGTRFALLGAALERRLERAPRPVASIEWAWRRLAASEGRLGVATLAAELGVSRQHLSAGFRRELGLPPKAMARILRFRRVVRALEAAPGEDWGPLALDAGYYDQAHFNRDFRAFAGTTPSGYLASLLPDEGGVASLAG